MEKPIIISILVILTTLSGATYHVLQQTHKNATLKSNFLGATAPAAPVDPASTAWDQWC